MADIKVSIAQRIKVDGKWTMRGIAPHLLRHSVDKMMLKDNIKGTFLIYWREKGVKKSERVKAGDLQSARKAARTRGFLLNHPEDVQVKLRDETNRILISSASALYLEEVLLSLRPGTHELLAFDLGEFQSWFHGKYMDEVTRLDLLKFRKWVEETGRSARTAANKMMRVNQFHRSVMKIETGKGLVTVRDAKVVEELPKVYSAEELAAFFGQCNPFQNLLFTMLLQTGMRMSELMYSYWSDIDFVNGVINVTAKPEFDFKTKTHEERSIPLTADLLARLLAHRSVAKRKLIFPTKSGRPNDKWLDVCKRIAKKAGLEPENFYLHKFRSTCATTMLQAGMDIKSVQHVLGHKDLDSTMRYLAPLRSTQMRSRLDGVWAVAAGG